MKVRSGECVDRCKAISCACRWNNVGSHVRPLANLFFWLWKANTGWENGGNGREQETKESCNYRRCRLPDASFYPRILTSSHPSSILCIPASFGAQLFLSLPRRLLPWFVQPTAVAAAPDLVPHMSRIWGMFRGGGVDVGVGVGVASCPLRVLQ